MGFSHNLLALVAAASQASATAYQGFNYGSTFTTGAPKMQSDFEADFKTAAGLHGTNGAFTSARFYTMIQGDTTDDVLSAIPAAINTKTSMLLGLWASAGQTHYTNELNALTAAISQYCDQGFADLVAGISVGSEDLYRETPTGIENHSGPGADAQTLVSYVKQTRAAIKGTCLDKALVGHVDTWNAYVNSTAQPLIDAVDWLGVDEYPYYETTHDNSIDNAKSLFQDAYNKVVGVAGGRPIWVTETGWPVSGKTAGDAVPGLANARTYWKDVGCPLFGNTNTWWYTLQDADPTTPNPSFGLIGSTLTEDPVFDLSCADVNTSTSTTSASSSATTSVSAAQSSSSPSSQVTTAVVSSAKVTNTAVTSAVSPSSTVVSAVVSSSSNATAPVTSVKPTTSTLAHSSGNRLDSVGAVAVALMAAALL